MKISFDVDERRQDFQSSSSVETGWIFMKINRKISFCFKTEKPFEKRFAFSNISTKPTAKERQHIAEVFEKRDCVMFHSFRFMAEMYETRLRTQTLPCHNYSKIYEMPFF